MEFDRSAKGRAFDVVFELVFPARGEAPNLQFPIWAWARRDVIQALHQVRRILVATAGVPVLAMAMDLLS